MEFYGEIIMLATPMRHPNFYYHFSIYPVRKSNFDIIFLKLINYAYFMPITVIFYQMIDLELSHAELIESF